jgi:hypothetical protein
MNLLSHMYYRPIPENLFKQKVLWSAIAYNIRVMTAIVIAAFQ